MLDKIFYKIGLGEKEVAIYFTLLEEGASTATNLSKKVQIPRSTLYAFLEVLLERGLVIQSLYDGTKLWFAQSPEVLVKLIDSELNEWSNIKTGFLNILPDLLEKRAIDISDPKFQYFQGIEGVKSILKDMLLYRDINTEAFWPISSMVDILGVSFFEALNVQRIQQNIYTKAIWPKNRIVDIEKNKFLGVGKEFRREIRIAPSEIDCTMGYWAYYNKVAFVSSRKECFGFIVESSELRTLLSTQFSMLWSISKPLNVSLEKTKEFLEKHIKF